MFLVLTIIAELSCGWWFSWTTMEGIEISEILPPAGKLHFWFVLICCYLTVVIRSAYHSSSTKNRRGIQLPNLSDNFLILGGAFSWVLFFFDVIRLTSHDNYLLPFCLSMKHTLACMWNGIVIEWHLWTLT